MPKPFSPPRTTGFPPPFSDFALSPPFHGPAVLSAPLFSLPGPFCLLSYCRRRFKNHLCAPPFPFVASLIRFFSWLLRPTSPPSSAQPAFPFAIPFPTGVFYLPPTSRPDFSYQSLFFPFVRSSAQPAEKLSTIRQFKTTS